MSLAETLEQNLIKAMKAKEPLKVAALRMVKADLENTKISKKKDKLDDQEILQILQKQVKLRRESLESFQKAGRKDLAEKEEKELNVLLAYLPKQLGAGEIKALAEKAIAACGAKTKADMGKVMKELMPQVKGKADGKEVNQIVSSLLE